MDIKIVSFKEGVNYAHDNMPTYQATVSVDGVKAFIAEEQGWGGPIHFSALPGKQDTLDRAILFAKSLPPIHCDGSTLPMDLELLIDDKVTEFLKNKDLEKLYRKTTRQFAFILFNSKDHSGPGSATGDGRPELRFFPPKFKVKDASEKLIKAITDAANKMGLERSGNTENVVQLRDVSAEHAKLLLRAAIDGDISKQEAVELAANTLSEMDFDPDRIERMTGVQIDNGPRS